VFQKEFARAGESGAAEGALEQLHTQVLLQFLDGPGQRRLLDMRPHGGACEVEFFGNGDEAPKMAQFHLHPARLVMCRLPSANAARRATFAPARNQPLSVV
jgi:hypothetical protein